MGGTSSIHVRLGSSMITGFGQSRLTINVPDGATMTEVVKELVRLHPALQTPLETAIVFVNGDMVDKDYMTTSDDSVAFLSPVAGG